MSQRPPLRRESRCRFDLTSPLGDAMFAAARHSSQTPPLQAPFTACS